MNNLSKLVRSELVQAPLVSGTTTNNLGSSAVDMAGFDGCRFTTIIGNSTAVTTVTLTAQGSDSTTVGTFQSLSGVTAASTVSNIMLQLDVFKSPFRYLRTILNTTLANVIGGTIADKYAPHVSPVTQSTAHVIASALGVYPTT